jgi:SET domain-containing protein
VAKCRPKRQQGKGWGLITVNGVKKGNLVLEYVGEVIDEKMKRSRLERWSKDHPNDPNFYTMQLEPTWYIDATEKGGLSRFINHSCGPNCHLLPVNVAGHMRVAIVALRRVNFSLLGFFIMSLFFS